MISAAARVTVSARLSGNAFVATSLVNTSVTTSPYVLAPLVFWEKSRSACSLSFGPSALFPKLCHVAALGRPRSPSDLVELPWVPSRPAAPEALSPPLPPFVRQKGFLRASSKLRNQQAFFWTRIAQKWGRCHPTSRLTICDRPRFHPRAVLSKRPQNHIPPLCRLIDGRSRGDLVRVIPATLLVLRDCCSPLQTCQSTAVIL